MCSVDGCDQDAIAVWERDGAFQPLCEDCGDYLQSRGWNYVSQV